mgnify:CR=1 FL=1
MITPLVTFHGHRSSNDGEETTENVMDEHQLLPTRFEEERTHLLGVAYRMLGSMD